MASVLGSLLVELGINTGVFKAGLDKATYMAQEFSKQMKESFHKVTESIGEMTSELGLFSPAMGTAVSGILNALGPLAGGVKNASEGFGVLAAAGAGVGLAAIALAAHTAEAAEKLYNLTQATGLSVATLSGLSLVAKTVGVDTEQLGRGLERMAKSAFTTAQSGSTVNNAYRTLGISVLDTNGKLRSTTDIFADVATKFSKMQDGSTKTALAMQMFGRAGAELIPVLNLGGEKVNEMIGHLTRMGAVITDDVAEASEELRQKIELLGAGFTGVENRLLTELVPALSLFANQLVGGLENSQGQLSSFITGVADVAKVVINIFQILGGLINLIGVEFRFVSEEAYHLGETLGGVYSKLKSGDITGAFHAMKDGAQAAAIGAKTYWDDTAKGIKDTVAGVAGVWTSTLEKSKPKEAKSENPTPVDTTFIDKEVQALQQRAIAAQGAASATSAMTQTEIEAGAAAIAHAAAQKLIDEATIKNVENTKAFKNALEAAIPKLQAAALWEQTFKAAVSDQTAFDSFNKKITQQIASLQGQAEAGGAVERQWAKNQATLKPLSDSLGVLTTEYDILKGRYGENDSRVQALSAKISELTQRYKEAESSVEKLNQAYQKNAVNEQIKKQTDELAALKGTTAALLAGGEAYAKIDEAVKKFSVDTNADVAAQERFRKALIDINAEEQKQAALKLASPGTSQQAQNLKIQIDYLKQLEAQWQEQGKDITSVEEALAKVNAEYADLGAKTSSIMPGIKAGLADWGAELKSIGETMQAGVKKSMDDINQQIINLVDGSKTSFRKIADDFANMLLEMALKAEEQKIIQSLFGMGNSGGGGGGGFLSGLGSLFGGGRAGGGDVTPGHEYMVGENGPERFVPSVSGTIVPNNGGAKNISYSHVQYISTPDADSFRKSQAQIASSAYAQMAAAHARNGNTR